MPRQLCCRGMCKIVTWSHHYDQTQNENTLNKIWVTSSWASVWTAFQVSLISCLVWELSHYCRFQDTGRQVGGLQCGVCGCYHWASFIGKYHSEHSYIMNPSSNGYHIQCAIIPFRQVNILHGHLGCSSQLPWHYFHSTRLQSFVESQTVNCKLIWGT